MDNPTASPPPIEPEEKKAATAEHHETSPLDILLFIKRHFLDGAPPFFNIIQSYGVV
jgi:hypothetical protein